MAYRISLSLGRLEDDRVRYALSPEDAAGVAWQMCVDYNINMPNRSWSMETWDSWEGKYETTPVTDHMVRGGSGKYPNRVEFCHCVIDQLTENKNGAADSMVFARAKMPYTEEPGGSNSKKKFETFRGQDRLLIEYDEDAEWSLMDDISAKLEDFTVKAENEGELDALAKLFEEKIQEIKSVKKRKKISEVD